MGMSSAIYTRLDDIIRVRLLSVVVHFGEANWICNGTDGKYGGNLYQ